MYQNFKHQVLELPTVITPVAAHSHWSIVCVKHYLHIFAEKHSGKRKKFAGPASSLDVQSHATFLSNPSQLTAGIAH